MPRLSLWKGGLKTADYNFFDKTISEYFGISGTAIYAHLYLGTYQQTEGATDSNDQSTIDNINSIEDVLLMENRDRKYSKVVYELRGCYNISDIDFDLRQFGLFLQNDTIFIEFHLNDLVALCGRRLIPGDVLELPHLRDDTIPNGSPAINKYYVVEDANKATDGYSATWFPHIWRVKCSPMPSSQEFDDILEQQATDPLGFNQGTLGSIISNLSTENSINQEIWDNAVANVDKRFFETQQFWFSPTGHDQDINQNMPWIFAGGGDAIPPNGAIPIGSGKSFPLTANEGDYYVRTDYIPMVLFRFNSNKWIMREVDWRGAEWSPASRLLKTFVNNDAIDTYGDGTVANEKTNLSKAVKPKADF